MTQERLQQAQQFLKTKQFDQARAVLETIADNPTAQKWLQKLDEIAPRPAAAPASPAFVDEPQPVEPEPEPVKQPMPDYLQDIGDYDNNLIPEAEATADAAGDSGMASSGVHWEYAILEQNINRMNNNTPMYRLEMLDASGEHRVMTDTDFDNQGAFNRTFKQLIAELGLDGWELIHIEVNPELRQQRTYTFKRRVELVEAAEA